MNKAFSALALLAFAAFACGYVIDGDCVSGENQYGLLSQCPHTLTGFRNFVELNATSKFNASQDLDFAFGFDTGVIKPRRAWYFKQNASHQVPVYCNVSRSRVCRSTNFSYTAEPKYAWCFNDSAGNSSVIWERGFVNGWPANKTIEWFEEKLACEETRYWDDWVPLQQFSTAQYAGKTWYVVTAFFEPNETKRLRAMIDVKPWSRGKYDVVIKRHSDSWQYAFDNGLFALLDPWWNSTWTYRKPLNVSEGAGKDRFMEPFYVNLTGLSLLTDNCTKEVRITANYSGGETEIPFMVVNNSGQAVAGGAAWCLIQFLVNMTTASNASYTEKNVSNYWVYYYNPTATDPGYSNLAAWNISFHGDANPTDEGWTVFGGIPCNSNYSYVNSGNVVWNANDTDASGRCRMARTDQTLAGVFTVEARYRAVSETGSDVYAAFGGTLAGVMNPAFIEVNTTAVGVGRAGDVLANLGEYNYLEADGTGFHVYRLLTDNASHSYWLYRDGSLVVSGTNASATIPNTRVLMGQSVSGGLKSWNGEIDFFAFTVGGTYPPLSSSLGGAELRGGVSGNLTNNCSETGASLVFNFTFVKEENHAAATASMDASFWLLNNTDGSNQSYSFNWSNVFYADVCLIGNDASLALSSWQQYFAGGHYPRNYFLDNASVSTASPSTISLFLANSSLTKNTLFTLKDANGLLLSDYTIVVQRYYASNNSFETIAMMRTDSNGAALTYLVPNTVFYIYSIVFNSALVETITPSAPIPCSPSLSQCVKELQLTDLLIGEYYQTAGHLTGNCSFNSVTNQTVCIVSDTSGLSRAWRLTVTKLGLVLNNVTCVRTLNTSSGVLTCDVADDGEYSASLVALGSIGIVDSLTFVKGALTSFFSADFVFLSLFVILAIGFAAIGSPAAGVFFLSMGVAFAKILGLLLISTGAVIMVVALGILIAWKLRA